MGLVCLLVAVVDVNQIPNNTEIAVGKELYDIFFKVGDNGTWVDFTHDEGDMDQDNLMDHEENHKNNKDKQKRSGH